MRQRKLYGTGGQPTGNGPVDPFIRMLSLFSLREWLLTVIGTAAALVAIGVPTAIVDNPVFVRMTPVRPQDYVIWVLSSVLGGLIIGSFGATRHRREGGKSLGGGILSYLAVGCPICNKLVVLLLGTSGALAWFAPLQLYIGIASIALLAWCLYLRARAITGSCGVAAAVESRGAN